MSLLEDVFLEDEAGEAQELERVIEGDEYDERPISPNSDENEEKEDEAEEDKRRVDPSQAKNKRVVRNPRFILNPARLTGPRGIQVIPEHFKDFKFRGKGHEKEDLDMVLKKLEHWAYRLYPKFEFRDCLRKIETLGKKRPVMVHLLKIRLDQITSEETVVQKDSSDDEVPAQEEDEFDKLLQQQIDLARSTPAPGSIKKPVPNTPRIDHRILMPKATSSPSISEEQKERMLLNKRLAEERRLAKLKMDRSAEVTLSDNSSHTTIEKTMHRTINIDGITKITDNVKSKKHNRSNVVSSSDDEEEINVNSSVIVDVHSNSPNEDVEIINHHHHRSNVINSSDDEVEVNVNSSVIVDVHSNSPKEDNDIEIINHHHHRSNVIDSSDDEVEINVNSSVIVDGHSSGPDKDDDIEIIKHHRSNVIDSSDDEETVDVNSSVIVDVHSNSPHEDSNDIEIINEHHKTHENGIKKNDIDKNVTNEISKDIVETNTVDISEYENNTDSIVTSCKDTSILNNDSDNNLSIESTPQSIDCIEKNDNVLTVSNRNSQEKHEENYEKSEMELQSVSNRNDSIIGVNKENIENFIDSELMDVDFNEDF